MFLHNLQEGEKKAFLELAHLVATVNGSITEQERQMIQLYDREMGIDVPLEDIQIRSLAEIVSQFQTDISRKACFVEAIAIAIVDGVYDEDEKGIIQDIRVAFGFSESYYNEVKKWLEEFNIMYKQGLSLVY